MGVVYTEYATGARVANSPVSAEGVIYSTLATLISGNAGPNNPVTLEGIVNVLAGTGTTAVILRCRQGNTVAGAQVGSSLTITLAAGATGQLAFQFLDATAFLNAPAGQYCLTLQQTGGTGAGTTNAVAFQASD